MVEQLVGYSALQARLHAVGGAKFGKTLMNRLAMATVREAKLLVPRKTGNLGRTIHAASVTETSATVVASANYALFVEKGTRAHDITPRARKALRWASSPGGARLTGTPRIGAAVTFARRVHHPGTRPHPFMLPGAKLAVSKAGLTDEIVTAWNNAA